MTLSKKIGIVISVAADQAFNAVEKVRGSLGKLEADAKKTDKAMQDLQAKLGAVGAGFLAGVHTLDQFAQRVTKVSAVMDNAKLSIDKARTATRGLVSDFELQRLANNAAILKVAETDEAFANLAGSAMKLGSAIGQGPVESIESMMAALGRGSAMMLDNLGISLKVEDAQKQYAKQLGVTVDKLTEVQKSEAFRVIAAQKIVEAADEVTAATNRSTDAIGRMKVQLEDALDAALQWAAADLQEDMDGMRESFQAIAGGGVELNKELKIAPQLMFALAQATKLAEKNAVAAFGKYMAIGQELTRINEEARKVGADIVAKDLRREEIRDIERVIAMHGNRKDKQAEINRLLTEQAELQAKSLELEGKLAEADEVRFQNELRQIRESASRGGGRRSSRWEGTEIGSMESRGSGIAVAADRADFQDQMSGIEMSRAGKAAQQAQDDYQIKVLEARQDKMNEFDKFAQEQLENEKKRLEEEVEARKKAEEEKQRAIEETMRAQFQVASATQALTSNSVQIASIGADAFIKGEKRKNAALKGLAGSEMVVIGIVETVKAAAAFAAFNYVEGALHVGAAALAFAKGGQLLSQAGGGGSSVGPGAAGSGFASGGAFGPGNDSGGGVQSSSGGSSRPTNNGPVSEREESVQRSGRRGPNAPTRNDGRRDQGPPIVIQYMGAPDAKFGDFVRKAVSASERKSGKVTS